jgi:hypothetical protein
MTSAANIMGRLVGELETSAHGLVSVEWIGSGFQRLKRVITAHNGGVCTTHASYYIMRAISVQNARVFCGEGTVVTEQRPCGIPTCLE